MRSVLIAFISLIIKNDGFIITRSPLDPKSPCGTKS